MNTDQSQEAAGRISIPYQFKSLPDNATQSLEQ
jgi:hypothetical protein